MASGDTGVRTVLYLGMINKIFAFIFILFIGIGIHLSGYPAYIYAGYLESKWVAASPQTQSDLEKVLNLYSKHSIDPKDSMWGYDYVLKNDEKMIQYLILWKAPLDVVYNRNDEIKRIFTSYE